MMSAPLEQDFRAMKSAPGALAIATEAQASSLAIIRRRDGATGTVALQSYPVATAPGTDSIAPTEVGTLTPVMSDHD